MISFTNNATATLSVAVSTSATTLVVGAGEAAKFAAPSSGDLQPVTLVDAGNPALVEVVYMTANNGSNTLTVVRAQEGTTAVAWAAGTKVEARVTAGMLRRFAQATGAASGSSVMALPVGSASDSAENFVVRGRSVLAGVNMIGGYNPLQPITSANPDNDINFAPEVIVAFAPADAGVAPTWTAGAFSPGAVVSPPSADGSQYWLHQTDVNPAQVNDTTWSAGNTSDGRGLWVATALPVFMERFLNFPMVITEAGVIARNVTATGSPVVSLGTSDTPGLCLSGVTVPVPDGSSQLFVHRMAVNTSIMPTALRFSVDSAATGGSFPLRPYVKGFFVSP